MRIMIWIGDEGPTDLDLKDGDLWAIYSNSWEPGAEELKRWLIVQIEEYGGDQSELTKPEYAVGASIEEPVVRCMRKYWIDYAAKLTPKETADVRNKEIAVPVLTGRFGLADIIRK